MANVGKCSPNQPITSGSGSEGTKKREVRGQEKRGSNAQDATIDNRRCRIAEDLHAMQKRTRNLKKKTSLAAIDENYRGKRKGTSSPTTHRNRFSPSGKRKVRLRKSKSESRTNIQ